MTQTPPPSPTPAPGPTPGPQVTELEAKLAEAAAQVAKVQAELSEARAADPNLPDVPVPYTGTAPVVMINGQQVPAGQAVDISAMLGGFFGGASAGGGQVVNIPPVVTVNGQVVGGGGQPVDLSSIVGPEAVAHIRSSLEQLGLGGQLGALFGGSPAPAAMTTAGPPAYGAGQPGPAPGVYSTTPGEITETSNKGLFLLAAVIALGIVGVVVYLMATG